MGSTIPILWWFTVLIAMTVGPAHCVSEFSRWTRWTRPLGVVPLESDNQGKQSSKNEGLPISETAKSQGYLNDEITPIELSCRITPPPGKPLENDNQSGQSSKNGGLSISNTAKSRGYLNDEITPIELSCRITPPPGKPFENDNQSGQSSKNGGLSISNTAKSRGYLNDEITPIELSCRITPPPGKPLENDNQSEQSSKNKGRPISKTTPVPVVSKAGTHTPIKKYDEKRGFLIGETTPVWDAYGTDFSKPFYYSYHNKWLVKQAIDEWMPLRWKADYGNIRLTWQDNWKGFWERNVKDVPTNLTSEEHDLHIFVAMDYPEQWPTDKKDEEKYMKEKILYAVAFWNAIHMRLRTTRNPRLRIRIDGIIFVHWKDPQTGMGLNLTEALDTTYLHSEDLRPTKKGVSRDFPRAVFTMTNSNQPRGSKRWNLKKIGSQLIGVIYDDLKFYGMVGFTAENQDMMRLLASSSTSDLKPAAYIQPGNPIVNPPMPGEVMPANKQCEAFGWDEKNEVASEVNWCNTFGCKNPGITTAALFVDDHRDVVDGTYCYYDKICMNRECVTKTDNTLKY